MTQWGLAKEASLASNKVTAVALVLRHATYRSTIIGQILAG